MKRPQAATVVLPVFDAGDEIAALVRDLAVAAYALRSRRIRLDVLLLHDADSPPPPAAVATAKELDVPLELLATSGGGGQAFLDGFRRALATDVDLVVTLDASGRHDPAEIPRMIDELIDRNLHVVIGSRWTRGSGTPGLSPSRWLLGKLANVAFRILSGTRGVTDATTSFRVARAEVVRAFSFAGAPLTSHSVQTAFVASALARGYRVGEAPIIYRHVEHADGALRYRDVAKFAAHLVGLRRQAGGIRRTRLSPAGRAFDSEEFGAADDLERLGTARYFFDWVLDEFDPYLRGRVLEVGAGTGTITRKLVDRYPDMDLVALEPADNMFADLGSFAELHPRVSAHHETLVEYETTEPFDAVVYLNVLEHIDDDADELERAARVLKPGGVLLVFGPGMELLYSELDHKAGHYRRYSPRQLGRLASDHGFEVLTVQYFDVLGVLPYLLVYKLLRHTDIGASTMWGYDRVVVPLSRRLQEAVGRPPLGKNVILIARKRG